MSYEMESLLKAIDDAIAAHPPVADTLRVQRDLLETGNRFEVGLPDGPGVVDAAKENSESAERLLPDEMFVVDAGQLLAFEAEVREAIARHRPNLAPTMAEVGSPFPADLAGTVQVSELLACAETKPEGTPLDQLAAFIARQTLYPFLRAYAEALEPVLAELEILGGVCPVCGGLPDMAAFSKPDGDRRLLCSLCDTEWLFARIGCPFCGNEDTSTLSYYAGDTEAYRLYVCEGCRRYLKTIDERGMADPIPLPVQRILRVGMDVSAQESGYTR